MHVGEHDGKHIGVYVVWVRVCQLLGLPLPNRVSAGFASGSQGVIGQVLPRLSLVQCQLDRQLPSLVMRLGMQSISHQLEISVMFGGKLML